MLKIKRSQLANMQFVVAMQKLAQVPMNTPTAFTLKNILQTLNSAREEMSADHKEQIIMKYSQKDEAGNVVHEDEEKTRFKVIDGMAEELDQAQKDFFDYELSLPCVKVNINNLPAQMSPIDLINLEPIYFNVEAAQPSDTAIPVSQTTVREERALN